MTYEDWEAAMEYHWENNRDILRPSENVQTTGTLNQQPATAILPRAGDRLLPNWIDQPTCTDYSEEAIPERDPSYQLPDGTLDQTQTVEYMPAAERAALARCLEQLGMSAARAAMVASL
jgi:hypothetical protein